MKKRWLMVSGCVFLVLLIFVLWLQQEMAFNKRTSCVGNLVRINLAKIVAAQELGLENGAVIPPVEMAKHSQGLTSVWSVCPKGGTYVVNVVGTDPICTYTNASYTWRFDWRAGRPQSKTWRHSLPK